MKTLIVVKGDTLSGLAKKYNTTVSIIKELNSIKDDKIFIGQTLKYTDNTSYIVVKGDTIRSICDKYKIDVSDFKTKNKIVDDALYTGQSVCVDCLPSVQSIPISPTTTTTVKPPEWFWPCLPWGNFNTRVGQFLDNAYYAKLHAVHPGQDINGNGGGDSDLNLPVYSVSDGIVVDVNFYKAWGWMVKIWHPYDKVWSVYAHLNGKPMVSIGQAVKGGYQIGKIGKGENNRYLAHLHFEIRSRDLPTPTWPSSLFSIKSQAEAFVLANYYNPVKFLIGKNARTFL